MFKYLPNVTLKLAFSFITLVGLNGDLLNIVMPAQQALSCTQWKSSNWSKM